MTNEEVAYQIKYYDNEVKNWEITKNFYQRMIDNSYEQLKDDFDEFHKTVIESDINYYRSRMDATTKCLDLCKSKLIEYMKLLIEA